MMHSDTPSMASSLLYKAASNYWREKAVGMRWDGSPRWETYQVISCLFERRQHQCRIPGLLDTESSDTENFTLLTTQKNRSDGKTTGKTESTCLICHSVGKDTNVTRIDVHTVRLHGRLNFGKDGASSSLDTQDFLRLHDVIGPGLSSDNT